MIKLIEISKKEEAITAEQKDETKSNMPPPPKMRGRADAVSKKRDTSNDAVEENKPKKSRRPAISSGKNGLNTIDNE